MMNLHVGRWCVRACPTLKWGYKGDLDNLCIIFSAHVKQPQYLCVDEDPVTVYYIITIIIWAPYIIITITTITYCCLLLN